VETIPKELLYSETHEWLREDDEVVVVGITEHAQSLLGEVVFVRLPEIGIDVHAGDEVCVLESVKAAGDVYSPVSGRVIEVNGALEESMNIINEDPYGDGWLFKLAPRDRSELDHLMDAEAYEKLISEQDQVSSPEEDE
jgi:glycine cleavage system H protein